MSYIGNQPTSVAFLTDQFSGNASTLVFTMSAAPATTGSILVNITGVTQDPTTYAVSGTTLTFSAAPPTGTGNISVRYLGIPASGVVTTAYRTVTEFTATAGQTSFSVPSYTVGYIDVFRNGVRLGSTDYTATTGTTVVLASGAIVGDLVVTESFYVSSVLNAIPATAGAVNSTYIANGAVGTTQIATGGVAQTNLAANVAGNGPAFSAYMSGTQAIGTAATKVQYGAKLFDTNTNYDNTTNYRFTPTVAGYYQIIGTFQGSSGVAYGVLYKNGAPALISSYTGVVGVNQICVVNGLLYCNGTTDYIEIFANSTTSFTAGVTPSNNYFQAFLARSA